MADELSLPFGPWTRLASAQWSGHPLSVYVNAENVVLMTIFDKSEQSINGMLILLKKPMLVEGKTDSFAASQNRELTFIEKASSGIRVKYLIIEATPYYAAYSQSELVKTIQRQYTEVAGTTKVLFEAAASYDFKVSELHPGDKQSEALLGDPFTLFALSSIAPGETLALRSGSKAATLLLGLDSSGQGLGISATDLSRAVVLGDTHSARLQAVQALCEASAVSGLPCLVFDTSGVFSGLNAIAPTNPLIQKFGLTPLESPLPFKAYAAGKGLFIDLRAVDLDWFESLAGLSAKETHSVLQQAYPQCASLEDLIQRVEALPESKQAGQYAIRKALRALRSLQKACPSTFGKNTFAEWAAPWESGVGKIFYVDLRSLDQSLQELAILSLLKSLKPSGRPIGALVVIDKPAALVSPRVQRAVPEDVGLLLSADHESDFISAPSAEFDVLNATDVAVSLPHREKKRVLFRPLLARFSPPIPASSKS